MTPIDPQTLDSISSSAQSTASSTTDSESDLGTTSLQLHHQQQQQQQPPVNSITNGISMAVKSLPKNPPSVAASTNCSSSSTTPSTINNGNYSLNTSCTLCLETLSTPKVCSLSIVFAMFSIKGSIGFIICVCIYAYFDLLYTHLIWF